MLNNYEVSINGILNILNQYFLPYINDEKLHIEIEQLKKANTLNQPTDLHSLSEYLFNIVLLDVNFISSLDPSQNSSELVLKTKTKGLIATMCYRVANYFYYSNLIEDDFKNETITREFMEQVAVDTSVDIHPAAKIGKCFFIDHAADIVIGSTCIIGENCNLFNDVVLGSKNVKSAKNVKRHPTLKNNVTICAGARVLGDITIGENVFVCPHAVVTDDVPDNTQVSIVNQLQLTKRINSVPSQKMIVFGIVPKFKNCINILGEGFYNPTVLIKLKNDISLNYQLTFWDKNKIIIKFKSKLLTNDDIKNLKVIILSNADKVIITNSYGLNKALLNLVD